MAALLALDVSIATTMSSHVYNSLTAATPMANVCVLQAGVAMTVLNLSATL